MPALALAVAGSAIGSGFAGVAIGGFAISGAAIGWTAGSLLGNALFAPTQKSSGPRLADLKAAQVAYGSVIPYVEGHPRLGGVIVWASEKREIATTQSAGGKGGGGSEVTTFTYEQDVLFMLSENELENLRRIWWNGEMVWSRAEDTDIDSFEVTEERWTRLTFYSGASSQMPDPTYEAAVGTENAPAYRGRATVFIEGLQLGNSGQLPNLTFEVTPSPADPYSLTALLEWSNQLTEDESLCGTIPPGAYIGDSGLSIAYLRTVEPVEGMSGAELAAQIIVETKSGGESATPKPGGATIIAAQGNSDVTVLGLPAAVGISALHILGDGVNLYLEAPRSDYLGTTDMRYSMRGDRVALATAAAIGTGFETWAECVGTLGDIYIFDAEVLTETIAHGDSVEALALTDAGVYALTDGTVSFYEAGGWTLDDSFAVPAGAGHVIFTSLDGDLCCVNSAAELYVYDSGWQLRSTMEYENSEGVVDLGTSNAFRMSTADKDYAVVLATEEGPPGADYRWRWSGYDPTGDPAFFFGTLDEAIVQYGQWWSVTFPNAAGDPRATQGFVYEITEIEDVSIFDGVYTNIMEATVDVEINRRYGYLFDTDPPGWYPTTNTVAFYRFLYQTVPTEIEVVRVYRATTVEAVQLAEPTLQEVVERQCVRGGLSLDYVDASELATKTVRGMVLSQLTSPRQAIETLMATYFFQCVESDILRFSWRGEASVLTIPYAGFVPSGEEEPLPITKANDLELPVQVFIKYSNVDDDYQDGSESSDRLISSGKNTSLVEVPLAFVPTEAKRIADANVMDAAASALRFGPFSLTREYAQLEPSDVVGATDFAGNVHRVRLLKKTEAAGVLTFEAVSDDADVVESVSRTDSTGYTNSTGVRLPVDTDMELLDIPLLRDEDDAAGFYAVAKPVTDVPFPGAALFKSPDDVTFGLVGETTQEGVFGVATTTLGAGTVGVFDEASSVTVSVWYGELSSTTRDAMLQSGVNMMLIGSEVIQFRTATLVTTGIYTLTGLLRGRRGTEWAVGAHAADERVVLLNGAVSKVSLNNSELGVVKYWKGVTLGRNLSTADSEPFTCDGVILKPFAPVDLRFTRDTSGNLTITCVRRTRKSCRFFGTLGASVPLGEESERYELDVLDGADVVRTLTSTNGSFSYTSAQQVTDFGGNQSSLDVEAFQLSNAVGRGTAAEATG